MKVKISADHEAMSAAAAHCAVQSVRRNSELLLCLATGATPSRAYKIIGIKARKSTGLLNRLRILKLDEWGGLPPNDPGSSETYLRQGVIAPWKISGRRFVGFATNPTRPKSECERIQAWLARNGPIDLCILGLGLNGHLGFNEPGETLSPCAHVASLAGETQAHPMVAHAAVKPVFGMTLGMGDILQSKEILLLVSGTHKRQPFKRLLSGEVSTRFPASFLHLHPNTTILCDDDAAG